MIPDHLIDKAWHAYIQSSNMQAFRNELAYPDLRGPMPPPPDPRQSLRAALEAVAGRIWDDGYIAAAKAEALRDAANEVQQIDGRKDDAAANWLRARAAAIEGEPR